MTTPFGPWIVGFRGQIIPLAIFADIVSDNWDGTIPPNLPDLLATAGYALDASAGSAQFNGPVYFPVGDVHIGGPNATDAQLFIDNILQHLNLRSTDDPDYPDQIGIFDVIWSATEGRAIRIFWADAVGPTFTRMIEIYHEASPPLMNFWPTQTASGTPALTITPEGLGREFSPAYLYRNTEVYTADDTFVKADYPGLRAIRVRLVGGGGGGSGSDATTAAQQATGGGGSGAGYAESWILESDLAASEAITVGQGGAASSAGGPGNDGTDSVFDTISGEVRAVRGQGGTERAANTGPGSVTPVAPFGGNVGNIMAINGGRGSHAMTFITISSSLLLSGSGGDTPLGFGGGSRVSTGSGIPGSGFGAGGGGAASGVSQSAQTGAAGQDGIAIVDVYT